MRRALVDKHEMQLIYDAAKDVFEGKYSVQYAISSLESKVAGTESSLKMYFNIYKCMRTGKCYKMGTSEMFTKFLLNNIHRDNGKDAYLIALSATKGNYAYRESVNNTQLGLKRACEESIADCSENIQWEQIATASFSPVSDPAISEVVHHEAVSAVPISQATSSSVKPITIPAQRANDDFELNIQPAASILNVFSRLSYKPWYAIAEFVDNSTQSYISHLSEMSSIPDFDKLVVDVKYNQQKNTLTITDNAYGMELERFRDAILLDSRNTTQSGRNEFGMGLKTAASWFGDVWTVESTQLGSEFKYKATVDIPKLKELCLNSVTIHREHVNRELHGTVVTIEQVSKKITGPRTIGKIRDLLSSMYRRDINNRNIEIWFNDEPIVFEKYPILENFRGKSWKKDLDFEVHFLNKTYRITGFVAIMNPGSFPKAGFALFRQDRVVIGGDDSNYKPSQIFGQAQSQKSLKLFGELNMNDFPVNQAKDGFIWDDGLEDAFVDALKDNIQEYIEIANMSIKERATESQYSEEVSHELEQDVSKALSDAFGEQEHTDLDGDTNGNTVNQTDLQQIHSPEVQEYIDTVLHEETQEQLVGTKRQYSVPISPVETIQFVVQWAIGNKNYWIEYKETEADKYEVLINIDHPFFMPFSKDESFKKVLEKFTLAFILAERQAKLVSDKEGYIPVNIIKNHMNKYLQKLAED